MQKKEISELTTKNVHRLTMQRIFKHNTAQTQQ